MNKLNSPGSKIIIVDQNRIMKIEEKRQIKIPEKEREFR